MTEMLRVVSTTSLIATYNSNDPVQFLMGILSSTFREVKPVR